MDCEEKTYNQFEAIDRATKVLVDYLITNNEDLWKLLKYIEPNKLPLSQKDLSIKTKASMISTNPYDVNEETTKNILFKTTSVDEAFTVAIPQVRFEIGEILPINPYLASMNIEVQIIVPDKQDLFTAPYNPVARRSDAILRELTKTFNGINLENSSFQSKLFMDRSASGGAGRKTGSTRVQWNNGYCGRWATFAVLIR